ncbi:hypothetical protein FOVSG1_009789 [Fusarium oxysporum f. sp. vasinfectum]
MLRDSSGPSTATMCAYFTTSQRVGTTGKPGMEALDESRSISDQPHGDQCSEGFLVVAAAMRNTRIRRELTHLFNKLPG